MIFQYTRNQQIMYGIGFKITEKYRNLVVNDMEQWIKNLVWKESMKIDGIEFYWVGFGEYLDGNWDWWAKGFGVRVDVKGYLRGIGDRRKIGWSFVMVF